MNANTIAIMTASRTPSRRAAALHDGTNQCQECAKLGIVRYTSDPGQLCRKHRRMAGAY